MIYPPFLNKGDKVAIIATARKITPEEIYPAASLLKKSGLEVLLGKNLFATHHLYAGTDVQRADDLQWALNHKEIKAIIIARGGYGTVRLMESVDFTQFKQYPKWLVGYSDVTVLHSAIHNIGIMTLHATMPINFTKNTKATKSLINALFGKHQRVDVEEHHMNITGKATAPLVGGNLSLLYALSGTPFDIDTRDKILFIEDLDEYLYHLDRMMMQLKLSGKLSCLKGLLVGGMTDMRDNPIPFGKLPEEIILDAVKDYNYPVCFDVPAGHISENIALYLGGKIELKVKESSASIQFL